MRKKNYNYTKRHDAIAKNLNLMEKGEAEFESPKDLLIESGYSEQGAKVALSTGSGIGELLKDIWSAEVAIKDVKRISSAAEGKGQLATALKALDMRFKLGGDYAATRTQLEVSGTVKHDLELGNSEYLDFKKGKLSEKEVIDGEVAISVAT